MTTALEFTGYIIVPFQSDIVISPEHSFLALGSDRAVIFNTYPMKTYVLLHFEHKNDVAIIVKLFRATRRRRLAL